ncbi:hypothetical protein AXF42_Ash001276 [Apostasia shenzhenica]|uniref:CUE domain-containing protein n=1 Tax=Apostasia shenzhenica TaxID=1088818 RepID=A0A2I0AUF3_9ASPA|nr:hypothetical protein AXF42_Ash001276 [Apostasia shenzhenica]
MSAVVCRKRSTSIFDDLQYNPPSVAKRIRCSADASSPPPSAAAGCFSPSTTASPLFDSTITSGTREAHIALLNHLKSIFPHMEQQYLERALEASGNNLDYAINSLRDLCLESAANRSDGGLEANAQILSEGALSNGACNSASVEESALDNFPKDGSEWVDLFVNEMLNASDVEDARGRASRALDALEKSIIARLNAEAFQNFQKESTVLKEQVEVLLRENTTLKRAVAIQHERQKDYNEKNQELHHLKQLVSQYQEQLSKLEVSNYALAMHLRQAQQGSSIPGRFHPDVF